MLNPITDRLSFLFFFFFFFFRSCHQRELVRVGDSVHPAGQLGPQPLAVHADHQALQAEAAIQVHLRGAQTHRRQGRIAHLEGQRAGKFFHQPERRSSRSGGRIVKARIFFLPVLVSGLEMRVAAFKRFLL